MAWMPSVGSAAGVLEVAPPPFRGRVAELHVQRRLQAGREAQPAHPLGALLGIGREALPATSRRAPSGCR